MNCPFCTTLVTSTRRPHCSSFTCTDCHTIRLAARGPNAKGRCYTCRQQDVDDRFAARGLVALNSEREDLDMRRHGVRLRRGGFHMWAPPMELGLFQIMSLGALREGRLRALLAALRADPEMARVAATTYAMGGVNAVSVWAYHRGFPL